MFLCNVMTVLMFFCSNHMSDQDMYSKIETNDEGDISMRNVITHIQTKGKEKWTLSFLLHKARKRRLFRLVSRNICFKFFLWTISFLKPIRHELIPRSRACNFAKESDANRTQDFDFDNKTQIIILRLFWIWFQPLFNPFLWLWRQVEKIPNFILTFSLF